jgi:hypothetical protein
MRYDGAMRLLQKIFGVFATAIGISWTVAKCTVDWTGRTTFVDDATQLGKKLNAASAWLLEQPSLLFYSTMVVLGLIGIFLIISPALPIREFLVGKNKSARLGFVMTAHPPFVDSSIITPDDGAISYHKRYVGIRNLDN